MKMHLVLIKIWENQWLGRVEKLMVKVLIHNFFFGQSFFKKKALKGGPKLKFWQY